MSLRRGLDGAAPEEPVGRPDATHHVHRVVRSTTLGLGTLACPACDAPVAPGRPLAPSDPLACPICDATGAVRDFLSLASPARPARVVVSVVDRRLRLM